jgi:hypothetical protein
MAGSVALLTACTASPDENGSEQETKVVRDAGIR